MTRFDQADGLATVLAEYGRLAAQLPEAEPQRAELLNQRLDELDAIIDAHLALVGLAGR